MMDNERAEYMIEEAKRRVIDTQNMIVSLLYEKSLDRYARAAYERALRNLSSAVAKLERSKVEIQLDRLSRVAR